MDTFKKIMSRKVGIGGLKCRCCNDYIGRERGQIRRYARHVLKADTRKALREARNA